MTIYDNKWQYMTMKCALVENIKAVKMFIIYAPVYFVNNHFGYFGKTCGLYYKHLRS